MKNFFLLLATILFSFSAFAEVTVIDDGPGPILPNGCETRVKIYQYWHDEPVDGWPGSYRKIYDAMEIHLVDCDGKDVASRVGGSVIQNMSGDHKVTSVNLGGSCSNSYLDFDFCAYTSSTAFASNVMSAINGNIDVMYEH